ncbi:MAG: DUF2591 family protein [Agitococcus sp.]|nr:DUF2591 family protein [Agitococcus sp.]MDO9179328.1 DUF2591 family protein [Agitococcus sp.]
MITFPKTVELTELQINWAIARLRGLNPSIVTVATQFADLRASGNYSEEELGLVSQTLQPRIYIGDMHQKCPLFSTDWAVGGPILGQLIEEGLLVMARDKNWATAQKYPLKASFDNWETASYGNTPLVTALRCYITREYGETVDIPTALVEVFPHRSPEGDYWTRFKSTFLLAGFTDDYGKGYGQYGLPMHYLGKVAIVAWCYPPTTHNGMSKLIVRGVVAEGTKQDSFYFASSESFDDAMKHALAYLATRVTAAQHVIDSGAYPYSQASDMLPCQ